MDNEKVLLNGKFTFKALPDGSLDKTKVIFMYCRPPEYFESQIPLAGQAYG